MEYLTRIKKPVKALITIAFAFFIALVLQICFISAPGYGGASIAYADSEALTYTDDDGTTWEYQVGHEGSNFGLYQLDSDSIEILGCDVIPEDGVLKIPDVIDGINVESIGYSAFYKNPERSRISEVIIPGSVKNIEQDAFRLCSNMKKLELNEGLMYIGYEAFVGCGVEELILPDSLTHIYYSFYYCSNLKSVTLPVSFGKGGSINYYFEYCDSLSEFILKEGEEDYVTVDGVVYNKDMTEIIAYPPGKSDELFTVPDTVETIGVDAFQGSKLKEIRLPDGLDTLKNNAFASCKSLTNIDIPAGVTEIPPGCFYQCDELETVDLKEGVTAIGENAFGNCPKLKGFDIPGTVKSIGNFAFMGDHSLTYAVIPEGVTSIGEHTFSDCYSLEYVSLPDSLTSIGSLAFQGNAIYGSAIHDLYIPENVETIEENAFYNCSPDLTIYSTSQAASAFAESHDMKFVNADRDTYEELTDSGSVSLACEIHSLVHHDAVGATCTSSGRIEYYSCEKCGRRFSDADAQNEVTATFTGKAPHALIRTEAKAATEDEDGNIEYWTCDNCGKLFTDSAGTIETSAEAVIIPKGTDPGSGTGGSGSADDPGTGDSGGSGDQGQTPGGSVKPLKQTIKCTTKYTKNIGVKFRINAKAKTKLSYRSSKKSIATVDSKGYVTIKGYGTCKITVTARASSKYLKSTKTITINGRLAKPTLKAVNKPGRIIKLTWSKVKGATGYKIYIKFPGKSKYKLVLTKSSKVKGVTHRGLTKGKKYSYKVRAFKKIGKKKVYSKFSKAVTVKVKK